MNNQPPKKKKGGARPGAGRPAKFANPRVFTIRMDESDVRSLEEAAALAGKPVTEWARDKLIAAAKRAAK